MTGPAAGIIAPVVTGFLYPLVGVIGVMVIDLSAFVAAFIVLLVVRIPQPARTQEGQAAAGTMWAELGGAFRFLWQRRIMLVMMLYAAIYNFLLTGPMGLNTPYIITLTGSTATLGVLMGVLNVGIIAGGVIMSIWGGTRPRIHGIMMCLLFRSFWLAVYGIVRSPLTLGLALFFIFFTNALIDGSFLSLVQLKTPPDMQGRVFALLFQLMYIASPLSSLLTGPLVDSVLTPAVGTPAWQLVEPIVGDGPASGMGLLLATAGTILCIVTAVMYAWPRTRRMESELPNYRATV
jgi:hypothetical protein